jgi:hypothetical protein
VCLVKLLPGQGVRVKVKFVLSAITADRNSARIVSYTGIFNHYVLTSVKIKVFIIVSQVSDSFV